MSEADAFLALSQPERDAAYNNRAAVAASGEIMAGWSAPSDAIRRRPGALIDQRYGERPRQTLDLFPGEAGRPVVLFVHGGYWQMNRKDDFAFVAGGPLAHGLGVGLIGYTLAPDITMAGIIGEIRAAVASVRSLVAAPIWLAGWSAGGHLVASVMDEPGVAGGLAISGIYDLEPIRHTYLNAKLSLDAQSAAACSPLRHLPFAPVGPLIVAYGTAELPQTRRQSRDYWMAWSGAGLPGALTELAGHDHFTILAELASADGLLTSALMKAVAGS